jgi:hypothetical protein
VRRCPEAVSQEGWVTCARSGDPGHRGGASTALGLDGGEEGRGQEPAAGEDIRGAGVPGDGTGVKWRSPASASAELAVGASANHRI